MGHRTFAIRAIRAIRAAAWAVAIWALHVSSILRVVTSITSIVGTAGTSWSFRGTPHVCSSLFGFRQPDLVDLLINNVGKPVHDVVSTLAPRQHLITGDISCMVHVHVIVDIVHGLRCGLQRSPELVQVQASKGYGSQ